MLTDFRLQADLHPPAVQNPDVQDGDDGLEQVTTHYNLRAIQPACITLQENDPQ